MDREVSSIVDFSVSLVALVAVLSIVVVTVMLGRDLMNDVTNSANDIKTDISARFVYDLAKGEVDNEMPTATALNIFTTYEKVISTTGCGICGETRDLLSERSCVTNHLSGRVQLEVLGSSGVYVTLIHRGDCNWFVGSCICSEKGVFQTVKDRYGL